MLRFTPAIFIASEHLRKTPIQELIDNVKSMREKCQDLFDDRWTRNILWIKDLFGAPYLLCLTMNTKAGEVLPEVMVRAWATGKVAFSGTFKLDEEGKLTEEDVQSIERGLRDYTTGHFVCGVCGESARRFEPGMGRNPTQEICAKCYAKPEVRTKAQEQFHQMSN